MKVLECERPLSLEEANERLPLVSRIMSDLVTTWREISERRSALESLNSAPQISDEYETELAALLEELSRMVAKVNQYVEEIKGLGGVISEFRRGIVTFPGELEGREVAFSWSPGEEQFLHFHETYESYLKRRAIEA